MPAKWVVKRKHPECVLGIYEDRDQATTEAEWRNLDYQTDDYVVERFDPERWGRGFGLYKQEARDAR